MTSTLQLRELRHIAPFSSAALCSDSVLLWLYCTLSLCLEPMAAALGKLLETPGHWSHARVKSELTVKVAGAGATSSKKPPDTPSLRWRPVFWVPTALCTCCNRPRHVSAPPPLPTD